MILGWTRTIIIIISSRRGVDHTCRRGGGGGVAAVGDEEATVGGELRVQRDAHQLKHPIREIQERAAAWDAQGVSGSMRGDGQQPYLAVLGGEEGSLGAVCCHVDEGALAAEPLEAHGGFLLRRSRREALGRNC